MTTHQVAVTASAHGQAKAEMVGAVVRGAETWQFFAFVFAAVVTPALALVDEIPDEFKAWRIAGKLLAFGGPTVLIVWPQSRVRSRVRRWLSTLFGPFTTDETGA